MREAIEALLRACNIMGHEHLCMDTVGGKCDCNVRELDIAAAAVRASLAPKPVPDGELLPCPFCGDRSRSDDPPVRGMRWVIQCDKCAARTASYETEALAVTAWNRRAELRAAEPASEPDMHDSGWHHTTMRDADKPAPPPSLVDRLRKAMESWNFNYQAYILFSDAIDALDEAHRLLATRVEASRLDAAVSALEAAQAAPASTDPLVKQLRDEAHGSTLLLSAANLLEWHQRRYGEMQAQLCDAQADTRRLDAIIADVRRHIGSGWLWHLMHAIHRGDAINVRQTIDAATMERKP